MKKYIFVFIIFLFIFKLNSYTQQKIINNKITIIEYTKNRYSIIDTLYINNKQKIFCKKSNSFIYNNSIIYN